MNLNRLTLAAAGLLLFATLPARAQAPPFFNGGGGIFDPEISVVQSGVILDAQAVVSADRKYDTMTTRIQSAQLLNLREFAFQTGGGAVPGQGGGGGAAGIAGGGGAANVFGRGAQAADRAAGAAEAGRHAAPRKPYPRPGETGPAGAEQGSLLGQEGMTLVGRVGTGPER